jgi:hypothetical protein
MQAKFGAAPADVLMVVRGFANEEHRMEETIKAIKHIAEWRDKVNIRLTYSHETSSASKETELFPAQTEICRWAITNFSRRV